MEIKIAICDDEENICYQLEKMLMDILKQRAVKYQIEVFFTSEELCEYLRRQKYDLIFLDIELPQISGIDVGRYIRDVLKDEIVQIAYISGKAGYAMDLFEFRPINFLIKTLEESKVSKVIDKYFVVTEQNNHMFEYKKKTQYYKVPMSEILYMTSKNRKVTIHKLDGVDEFYETMENVYTRVKGYDFLFIHKSIVINYRFIKRISYEEVMMLDDEVLPISQSRRKAIKSMYMKIRKKEM